MRTRTSLLFLLILCGCLCWAQSGNKAAEDKLVQTEKQLWEAWKNHNAEPFKQNLAPNALALTPAGLQEGIEPVVQMIMSGNCEVNSYSLEDTKVTWLDSNTALLTYKGMQDATCDGHKAPSSILASSIYVKRGKDWKAMYHQETPAGQAMQSQSGQ